MDLGLKGKQVFITGGSGLLGCALAFELIKKNEVISEGTAYRMLSLMQGVVDGGTSVRLRYKYGFKNEIVNGKKFYLSSQKELFFLTEVIRGKKYFPMYPTVKIRGIF